jgi:hypothetical protein
MLIASKSKRRNLKISLKKRNLISHNIRNEYFKNQDHRVQYPIFYLFFIFLSLECIGEDYVYIVNALL